MGDRERREGSANEPGKFDASRWRALLDERRRQRWQPLDFLAMTGVSAGQVAVDLGSGPGFWTLPLAQLVGESGTVWAIDSSQEMLAALADGRPPAQVRLLPADLPAIPLADAVADFAWAAFVFHEVAPPERLAEEARRVLRPGGRLAVLDWRPESTGKQGPPPAHRLAADHVVAMLRRVGFTTATQRWSDADTYLVVAE